MKPSRLRIKVRKLLEQVDEATEEGGELNIIPYLDIVTNIIMFMLATTTFAAALGDINVSSPATSAAAAMANPDTPPKDDLNLTVSISDKGFTIAAAGAVLHQGFSFDGTGNLVETTQILPTIPKKGTEFDYELLGRKMLEIKKSPQAASETKVIINANAEILYETVVAVMDACRGKQVLKPAEGGKMLETYEGFADVLLSAGLN